MSRITLAEADDAVQSEQVIRKVFWRIVPFLFVLYVISYLDRINIGFAALTMNKELGLTPTTFGLANSVFYIGYVLCEIPSNLLLVRYGAHRWIPRIMVTWGIASAATMLASGATSLYIIRLLVGVAEAGFLPGILLYMTYWFPSHWRARATSIFMIAQPVTIAFGATVSGMILGMDGFLGLSGWRWLFLIEGLPAIALGIAGWFYLDRSPNEASWLSAREKAVLQSQLETVVQPRTSVLGELTSVPVLLLCLSYFGLVTSLNTMATWTPQIVRNLASHQASYAGIGLLSALPAVAAAILMPIWSAHSDKTGERLLHYVLPAALTGLGWVGVVAFDTMIFRMIGLTFATAGAFTAMVIFWTIPGSVLSDKSRPAGIALISSAGILASAISPSVIGVLRDLSGSFASGLWYAVILMMISIAAIVSARPSRSAAAASAALT